MRTTFHTLSTLNFGTQGMGFARGEGFENALTVTDEPEFDLPEGGGATVVEGAAGGRQGKVLRPHIPVIEPEFVPYRYDPSLQRQAIQDYQKLLHPRRKAIPTDYNPLEIFTRQLEKKPQLLLPFNDAVAQITRGQEEQDGLTSTLAAVRLGLLVYAAGSAPLTAIFTERFGTFVDFIRQQYVDLNSYKVTDRDQHIRFVALLSNLGKNPAFPETHLVALFRTVMFHCGRAGVNDDETRDILRDILVTRPDVKDAEIRGHLLRISAPQPPERLP